MEHASRRKNHEEPIQDVFRAIRVDTRSRLQAQCRLQRRRPVALSSMFNMVKFVQWTPIKCSSLNMVIVVDLKMPSAAQKETHSQGIKMCQPTQENEYARVLYARNAPCISLM